MHTCAQTPTIICPYYLVMQMFAGRLQLPIPLMLRARPTANQNSHHALFRRARALIERDVDEKRTADGQTETDQKTLLLVQRIAKDHDRKRVSHHIPKKNERHDSENTPGNRHVRVS